MKARNSFSFLLANERLEKKQMSFCIGRHNHRKKQVLHECILKSTGLNSTSPKWMRLKWMWSQM